jgi:hypothetical protein
LEKSALLNNLNSNDLIKNTFNQALNAGLQTSDDYLQVWHCYLDFLKRSFMANKLNENERQSQIEEIRDAFQKAINQLFDCKEILSFDV